jgi:hypothetical protein
MNKGILIKLKPILGFSQINSNIKVNIDIFLYEKNVFNLNGDDIHASSMLYIHTCT